MTQLPPLCVDLDGTLIRTDTLQETMLKYIWRWPYKILNLLLWLMKGRAYLKQQLASAVSLRVNEIPINQQFLAWLHQEKQKNREIILVTASDQEVAQGIAKALKIFDATLASDGCINLRAEAKAQALVNRYGKEGFAYAGNSKDDLKVWAKAGEIIAVNTPVNVLEKARMMGKPLQIFEEGLQPCAILYALWRPVLLWTLIPFVGSYLCCPYALKNHFLALLSTLFKGTSLALLSDVLSMRALPARVDTPIFQALKYGRVRIPLALYTVALLSMADLICLSFIPLHARLSLTLLGFVWLCLNMYPPHSKIVQYAVQLMLLASLFCTALAFL
jgi:phosphoserine phosphatase